MARSLPPLLAGRLLALTLLGFGVLTGLVVAGPAWAAPPPAPAPAPGASTEPPPNPDPTPATPSPIPTPPPGGPTPSVPSSPPTPEPSPNPAPTPDTGDDDDPGLFDIPGQIRKAISDFLAWLAESTINPVLEVLARTVLSTPDLAGSPHVRAVWTTSLVVANGVYVLFILAGAFIVASRETLQGSYGLKEIAPRLAVGAVLSNTSLLLCGNAIEITNAVTAAIVGQGVDGRTAAAAILGLVDQPLTSPGNILMPLLVLAVVVLGIVVVITFVLRVALLVTLVGFAPVALVFHATPQTEGIAYTWWRAFAACLGLQVGQGLVVLATVKVFLTPSGLILFGVPATTRGLLGVLVCLTMLWLLIKLPGLLKQFVLAPMGLRGQGRGLVGQLVQAYVMFKTVGAAAGLLAGAGGRGAAARPAARQGGRGSATTATSSARPVSAVGGHVGSPRPAPSWPSPPGPVAFSNATTTQTPLPAATGTAGAPEFSHAPQPATPAPNPTGPAPAAPFSHANPSSAATVRPRSRPAPAAFSDATPAPASRKPTGPPPAATFSNRQPPQSAPRRQPSPSAPVFSSAPSAPAARPTAARRPTAASGPAARPAPSPSPAPSPGSSENSARPSPRPSPSPRPVSAAPPPPSPPSPPPVRRRPRGDKA